MKQYHDLVRLILENGERKSDRTGTGTISMFGLQTKYDLRQGFPLITTKKVNFSAVVRELLWFLRGATNINDDLTQHTAIWDAWAREDGELGPIYGYQWRSWPVYKEVDGNLYEKGYIDQISNVIHQIKTNPDSRRLIVTAWNVSDLDKMALPPCHMMFQFYVCNGRLDIQLCRYCRGRSFQHCQLCPAQYYDCPGVRADAGNIHPYLWRCPYLS